MERGSVAIALKMRISTLVVGMTIVSFATSAPELFVSLQAVLDGSSNIAFGNLIGSNIFNILAVLGVTASIKEINIIDAKILTFDYMWMIAITLIVGLFIYTFSKSQISRKEGIVLLLIYISYLYFSLS